MARRLAAVALGAIFLAALVLATRREAAVDCEVCLSFQGQTLCRQGAGSDRDAAVRSAVAAACAVLSGGVTQGLQCDRTPPRSVECSR